MKERIGEFISKARREKNMSMRELSRLSEVSHSEIARIESGERQYPKLKTLKAICRYLNIYYEECLYIMNMGGTYNINNPFIIEHYQNLTGNSLKKSYEVIRGQLDLNNSQLLYLSKQFNIIDKIEDKNTLIDTIKSLEYENKVNNFIKNILEKNIVKEYLKS